MERERLPRSETYLKVLMRKKRKMVKKRRRKASRRADKNENQRALQLGRRKRTEEPRLPRPRRPRRRRNSKKKSWQSRRC